MPSVGNGWLISVGLVGALCASFALWGFWGLVLVSCMLLLAGCVFYTGVVAHATLTHAVAATRGALSQQLESVEHDLSARLDSIESEIADLSDDDDDDYDYEYRERGPDVAVTDDDDDEDEENDEDRDSRIPTPGPGIAYIFQTLPARFQGSVIDTPRTYYFSLEEEKWTVSLSTDKCEVTRGKPATDADCAFEASKQMFLDVWHGNYVPSANDFLTGAIKCDNPRLLKDFVGSFKRE